MKQETIDRLKAEREQAIIEMMGLGKQEGQLWCQDASYENLLEVIEADKNGGYKAVQALDCFDADLLQGVIEQFHEVFAAGFCSAVTDFYAEFERVSGRS